MKKTVYVVLLLIIAPAAQAMAPDSELIGPDELQERAGTLPAPIRADVDQWMAVNAPIVREMTTFNLPDAQERARRAQRIAHAHLQNRSSNNYIFMLPNGRAAIKIGGAASIYRETLSALGKDPYHPQAVTELGGYGRVTEAANNPALRRFQGLSSVAYHRVINDLNPQGMIKVPNTYFVHIPGRPTQPFDDKNYVVVQEIVDSSIVPLSILDERERQTAVRNLNLEELYKALKKSGLWNLDADNILINRNNPNEIWITDLEKPNNEGFGAQSKWPVAVFGSRGVISPYKPEAEWNEADRKAAANARWKWRNNIRAGHDSIMNILVDTQQKQLWKALRDNDPDIQN